MQHNKTYRVISDQVGTPMLVVDANSGKVVEEYSFDEFGVVEDLPKNPILPFGFAGGLYDDETGLVHFGMREYDAEMGRWTTKDPIGFNGGDTNLYGYVANDPVNFVDPSGLARCTFSIKSGALVCKSNNSAVEFSTNAFSGSSGTDAIPVGSYTIGTAQGRDSSFFHLSRGIFLDGVYQVSKHYFGTSPAVRGGFMIHPGTYSSGCITIDKNKASDLQQYQHIQLLLLEEIADSTLEVTN